MEKNDLGLSKKNLSKLDEIEDQILDLDSLDDRMNFVDELVIWTEFPDDVSTETEDEVKDYLKEFVMETL